MQISNKILIPLLIFYISGIFIWDYTIEYKVALLLMLLFILLFYKNDLLMLPKSYHLYTYSLLAIYFLLHTLFGFSINNSLSYEYTLTLFINLLASICIIKILNTKEKLHTIMKASIWITLAICLYIIIIDRTNIVSGSLGQYVKKPFTDILYMHNTIPMLCGFSLMFLMYFKLSKIKFTFINAFIVFNIIFVILSGARKSLIFVIFAVIIYPYLLSGKREDISKKLINSIIVTALLALGYILLIKVDLLYQIIGERVEGFIYGLFTGDFSDSSSRTRSIMLDTGIQLMKKKPFVGYGLDTFRTFPGSFHTWSHNTIIELTVSGGIIATLIYYFYYIYTIIILIKKFYYDKLGSMFLCIMIFLIIHSVLSVSYANRSITLIYAMIDSYILLTFRNKYSSSSMKGDV